MLPGIQLPGGGNPNIQEPLCIDAVWNGQGFPTVFMVGYTPTDGAHIKPPASFLATTISIGICISIRSAQLQPESIRATRM